MYDYSRQIYEFLQQYLPGMSKNLEKLDAILSTLSGFYPLLVVMVLCLLVDRVLRKGDMM